MDTTEVEAGALRQWIVCGKTIQVFGADVTRFDSHMRAYSTASKAPWHVKPAPNDDIHHQPPGVPSARAASSTK